MLWCCAEPGEEEWQVFLSHSGKQKRRDVDVLYDRLRHAGVRVFVDWACLKPGGNPEKQMHRAAENALVGLALLTPDYVSNDWPMQELDIFLQKETLLPLFYDLTPDQCSDPGQALEDAYAAQVPALA